jgi:acetoin utilization protein AcuB
MLTEKVSALVERFNSYVDVMIVLREDETLYNCISVAEMDYIKSFDKELKLMDILDPVESFLFENDMIEDALNLIQQNRITVLPVVDYDLYPVGTIGIFEIIKAFKSVSGMNEPGTKITVSLNEKPGQLRTLLDIFTSKDINILSLLTSEVNNGKRSVTLKVDMKDVNAVSELLEANTIEYDGIFEEDGGNY